MKELTGGSSKRLTVLLVIVITVLVLVGLYFLVLRPSINGYVVKQQNQGVMIALSTILNQIDKYGYTILPIIGTNQTITLIPPQLCGQLAKNSSVTLTG